MGDIDDALDRAGYEHVTKPPPKTPAARMRPLLRAEKGSTKAVARRLGISQRQVERYLSGRAKPPPRLEGGPGARGGQGLAAAGAAAGPQEGPVSATGTGPDGRVGWPGRL
ncbi:helix-turn-helix domain-containing protein [Streptomyces phaeofaciens]|uniref:helix-turn-helix domain-containing protein n=1 Tax=Streptomyces phaeofaciens TaxID=68254 RepID=UPI0036BD3F8C